MNGLNGIIIDGKVYEAVEEKEELSCDGCDLTNLLFDKFESCPLLDTCSVHHCIFRFSQSLTDLSQRENEYSIIHTGTLREVELDGMTPQEWAKRELDRIGREKILTKVKGDPDYIDILNKYRPFNPDEDQRIDEKFIEVEGRLFEIVKNRCKEGGWFSQLKSNPDGTYDYTVEFINGQTSLTEIIGDMLRELPDEIAKQNDQTDGMI